MEHHIQSVGTMFVYWLYNFTFLCHIQIYVLVYYSEISPHHASSLATKQGILYNYEQHDHKTGTHTPYRNNTYEYEHLEILIQ